MAAFRLDQLWEFLAGIEPVVGLLWLGLVALTITLLVLMRTRWGQSRPLRKCLALSILAHLLLAGYATTVRIVCGAPALEEPVLYVSFVDGPLQQATGAEDPVADEEPWERFLHQSVTQPEPVDPRREQPTELPEPERQATSEETPLPGDPSLDHLALSQSGPLEPQPVCEAGLPRRSSPATMAEQIEAPAAERRDATPLKVPAREDTPLQATARQPRVPLDRVPRTGVPTSLLSQPVPLPRLDTPATTLDPASSLAGLTSQFSRPARSQPAESAIDEVDRPRSMSGFPGATGERLTGPSAEARQASLPVSAVEQHAAETTDGGMPPSQTTTVILPKAGENRRDQGQADEQSLPSIYRLRVAPDRSRMAQRQGATPATEAAVKAALKWLADNQHEDGRWDAADHGAGREMQISGRNRDGAGIEADTGVSGLALLAMLASGHTHQEGAYRENVRRGLQYLLRIQARDGNLGGRATAYAKMYCHSMAAFAMSEAYGMTGDERLRLPVRRAIAYTLAAQSPQDGGWRYRPGDPGDTSQAGWQLMALKSAELAGIPMPVESRNGLILYLRSACSGTHGGLASYRPGEPVSRPMTAEALACWQFLGMPREHPAGNEAGDYLLGELPGQGSPNLYYWYYATLAMYQLQGIHWKRWNDALRTTLIDSQQTKGTPAGSWDPATVWGGYGGRVYSTALATLCLEVYYRFLPLYVQAAPAEERAK